MLQTNLQSFVDMPMVEEMGISLNLRAQKMEYHRNGGYEICFSFSGAFAWEFKNGRVLSFRGHQISLTHPDCEHRGYQNRMNPGHMLFMVINPEKWGSEFPGRGEKEFLFDRLNRYAGQADQADSALIHTAELLDKLWREAQKRLANGEKSESSSLSEIKYALQQNVRLFIHQSLKAFHNSEKPVIPAQLQDMLIFIESHLSEKITVEKLVKISHHSHSRIFSLFKEFVGQAPNDYIQYQRCRRAAELLTKTELKVIHISFDMGFSSSQYFSQVFKKYMGLSPRNYRVRYQSPPLRLPP